MPEAQTNGQGLPRLAFSVLPGSAEGLEAWRWAVAPMFDCELPDPEARKSYWTEIASYHFGGMRLGMAAGSASIVRRHGGVIARSGLDDILVQVYRSSSYRLTADGEETVVEAGDVALIDLSREMTIEADQVSNITAVLPRRLVEPLVADLDGIHGRVLRKETPFCELLSSHVLALEREAAWMPRSQGEAVTLATAALTAAAIGASSDGSSKARAGTRTALLQMARREIDSHLADPALGPEFLMRRLGLSRAALYRLFEPLGGVSRHIRRRRLSRAFREITSPSHTHERIGAIAYRWGFTNLTSLGRLFRQTYGMTPQEARQAALDGNRPDSTEYAAADAFSLLNRWVSEAG